MMKQYSNTCHNCFFITQDISFHHYYEQLKLSSMSHTQIQKFKVAHIITERAWTGNLNCICQLYHYCNIVRGHSTL